MSEETVKEVIIKAVSDPEFRELLFSNPVKALEGFDLKEEEVEALKQIDMGSFEEYFMELGERTSRAGINIGSFTQSVLAQKSAQTGEVTGEGIFSKARILPVGADSEPSMEPGDITSMPDPKPDS